jgi:outer membrane immunogenic protein
MRYQFLCATGLLAAVVAGPGLAADLPVAAPVYKAPTWTGFYIGADVGGVWTRSSGEWDPGAAPGIPTPSGPSAYFGEFPISSGLNDTAVAGGVHVGYNLQFAPVWVVGVEADWSWTGANVGFTQPWVNTVIGLRPNALTNMGLQDKWMSTARARIGYLMTPATLVYFTGGGAWGQVNYSATAANEPPSSYIATSSFSKTVPGYVLGGGLEYQFWNNWSLRGEYLYYHLNSSTTALGTEITGNFPAFSSTFKWTDTEIQTVRAGLSYKF